MSVIDEDEILDASWLIEQERIHTIQNNFHREPMKTIKLYFVYINNEDSIDNINSEVYTIQSVNDKNCSIITQDELLHIIQSKKKTTPSSKYVINDILLYNIDLEHEQLQSFTKYNSDEMMENSTKLLKSNGIIKNMVISPSIFIFHNINAIYFIFKELVKTVPIINNQNKLPILSIVPLRVKETKRVRFKEDTILISKNKTKKQDIIE